MLRLRDRCGLPQTLVLVCIYGFSVIKKLKRYNYMQIRNTTQSVNQLIYYVLIHSYVINHHNTSSIHTMHPTTYTSHTQIQIQIFYWLTKRDRLYRQYKQKIKTHTYTRKQQQNDTKIKDVKGWRNIGSCPGLVLGHCVYKKSYDSYIIGTFLDETHRSYIHAPLSHTHITLSTLWSWWCIVTLTQHTDDASHQRITMLMHYRMISWSIIPVMHQHRENVKFGNG